MKIIRILITLLLAGIFSLTFAATNNNYDDVCTAWCLKPIPKKYYVGGLVGLGEGAGNSNIGLAWGGFAGYRFNSNMAGEFIFDRTPRGTANNTAHTNLFGGAVKVSLPFSPRLDGFAKLGLGVVNSGEYTGAASSTRFGFLIGTGADYYVSKSVALSAQLLGTMGGTDADTFAVLGGVAYLFA